LNSREASNLIEIEPRLFVSATVSFDGLAIKVENFVEKPTRVCFVDSTKISLSTTATESELAVTWANLRFLIFNVEPRAGSK